MQRNTILHGDALMTLKQLPDNTVQCVCTSPPYYNLRDYQVEGQLGLERTPAEYVAKIVDVFREVRRVLRSDGTAWMNLGDSFAGGRRGRDDSGDNGKFAGERLEVKDNTVPDGFKDKDLMMIPHRVAIAMQDSGWWVRSDSVWEKPNVMPESCTDRPTRSHEYVFLLTKNKRYYYDADAIREPLVTKSRFRDKSQEPYNNAFLTPIGGGLREWNNPAGRSKRSVWSIPTESYKGSHFATMPKKLAEICVLAGSSPQACEKCQAPWQRIVERTPMVIRQGPRAGQYGSNTTDGLTGTMITPAESRTIGWEPTCNCDCKGTGKCIVLDPFAGAGTTLLVASQLGRDWLGIELSGDYINLAMDRMAVIQPTLWQGGVA